MSEFKILFADDQLPDEAIPDDQIKEWSQDSINPFVAMRQAVNTLRAAGYIVIVARTYHDAIRSAQENRFNAAIIDLGWFGDPSILPGKREYAGFELCNEIDKVAVESHAQQIPLIIYSDRFLKNASSSMEAAKQGRLPVFKNYEKPEAGHAALTAAVRFIEAHAARPSAINMDLAGGLKQTLMRSYSEQLDQQKRLFQSTQLFVAVSLFLILVGSLSAIFWNIQVGTITSISSVITGAVSSLLFVQLQRKQREVERTQEKMESRFEEIMAQVSK